MTPTKNKVAEVRDTLINFPNMGYAEVGIKHGLKANRIARIAQDMRAHGVDPRSSVGKNPVPTRKVTLPEDLCALAVEAVRVRLTRLADPNVLAAESPRDLREAVRMLTEIYDLFSTLTPPKAGSLEGDEDEEPLSFLSQLKSTRTL